MGGVGGHAGDMHPTRTDMEKEQYEVFSQPGQRPDLDREKITSPKRSGVAVDEIGPGAFAAFGSRVDAVGTEEDVGDRGARHAVRMPSFFSSP